MHLLKSFSSPPTLPGDFILITNLLSFIRLWFVCEFFVLLTCLCSWRALGICAWMPFFFSLFPSKRVNCKYLPPLLSLHGLGPMSASSLISNEVYAIKQSWLHLDRGDEGEHQVCQSVAQIMLCSVVGSTCEHLRLVPSAVLFMLVLRDQQATLTMDIWRECTWASR